ncbi:N-acetyl-gamma-glutamyl-phosphate reductase [Glycomyces buryatensis]|uniref:N-acetyl-gamma-glutamyl-phosphate reductase n=1 Tax=Glycomyces buryatensis TaxID=2570927 RepID=A0A4S8QK07_9ACTN|nr:N-acetyl-gamma-glutamyl-phosphate reductase [Glycomyces buryatensis]THV41749.1 N-acetyl-gamma-glutamyl-phosphate reductase [Glycomyces buryatensis]
MTYQVAVAGASGYAGGEVLRILADHPQLEVVAASAHSQAGESITAVHPHLTAYGDRRFCETTPEALSGADLVIMTLPHGQSAALAAQLPADLKVVDLGADHRLEDAAAWEAYYPGPHAGAWTYGLPELAGQREAIAASNRVAATGCYAVATILALRPLLDAGIADPSDVVVVAASGTSGAGNSPKKNLLASEVIGSMSPYKVGAHQHVPEIKQATGATSLSMTPLLAPMPRGIISTVTARPAGDVTAADVRAALSKAYDGEHFVHLLAEGAWPATASTYGTNAVQVQGTVDRDSGRIIVTAAIDNLGKGAAGQVVQCANLMLGLPEAAGLTVNGVAP